MSHIFISHSSKDRNTALRFLDRLKQQKYQALFLDFDPEAGIKAGMRWERELYRKLRLAGAVVVLCSPESMDSRWCFAEITQAKALGKALFPVVVRPCALVGSLADVHVIDLTARGEDEAFARLLDGLRAAGLDPADSFNWDSGRPPFPGFLYFNQEDAGIYFGRDTEVRKVIETLTTMRRHGDPRLAVIVGSSGSGKSSLVRAGVLPRLGKDPSAWAIVPPFRPLSDPITELARALETAFPEGPSRPDWKTLRDRITLDATSGSAVSSLLEAADDLTMALKRREASVLLVIDQAEELLQGAGSSGSGTFLAALLRATGHPGGRLFALLTLRSDFLGSLQNHPVLRGVAFASFPLGLLTVESFAEVIEGPAARAVIDLEPGLVRVMTAEAKTDDALPLLAFTLREMYERCREQARLTLKVYRDDLGGIQGAVARTVERIKTEGAWTSATTQALRRAFLRLARVNDEGRFTRQSARWADLPAEAAPVLERFVQARLLSSDGDVVEVTHESLFRVWPELAGWLDEGRELMLWKKGILDEVRAWLDHQCSAEWLLSGARAAEARRWLKDNPDEFSIEEGKFLAASVAAEDERRERLRKLARNLAIAAGVATILAIGSIGVGFYAYGKRGQAIENEKVAKSEAGKARDAEKTALENEKEAKKQKGIAEEQTKVAREEKAAAQHLADVATVGSLSAESQLVANDFPQRSLLLAAEAARIALSTDGPRISPVPAKQALYKALSLAGGQALPLRSEYEHKMDVSADHSRLVFLTWTTKPTNRSILIDVSQPTPRAVEFKELLSSDGMSPDLRRHAAPDRNHASVLVRNLERPDDAPVRLTGLKEYVISLAFSPDAHRLAGFSPAAYNPAQPMEKRGIWHWDLRHADRPALELRGPEKGVDMVAYSRDGRWLAAAHNAGQVAAWDLSAPEKPPVLRQFTSREATAVTFAKGSRLLVSGSSEDVWAWDLSDPGKEPVTLPGKFLGSGRPWPRVFDPSLSPSGRFLVTEARGTKQEKTATVVSDLDSTEIQHFELPLKPTSGVAFDRREDLIAIVSLLDGIFVYELAGNKPDRLVAKYPDYESNHGDQFALDPEGTLLAISKGSGGIVWRFRNGSAPSSIREIRGPEGSINRLSFSPDGRRIIALCNDRAAIRQWDVDRLNALPGRVVTAPHATSSPGGSTTSRIDSVSRSGHWMLSHDDSDLLLYDLHAADGKVTRFPASRESSQWGFFSEDERWFFHFSSVADAEGVALAHDLSDLGKPPARLPQAIAKFFPVQSVDGGRALLAFDRQEAFTWVPGGKVRSLGIKPAEFLAASPDGRWLVLYSYSGHRAILRDRNGTTPTDYDLGVFPPPAASDSPLAVFDASSRWLAAYIDSYYETQVLRLWQLNDLKAGPASVNLGGSKIARYDVLFTPDGHRLVVTGRNDRIIRVYDPLHPGAPLVSWRGHEGVIYGQTVSPDGHWLLTAEGVPKTSYRLWDLVRLDPDPIRFGPDPTMTTPHFGAGGRELLMGSESDRVIRAWPLETDALLSLAAETAGRNLSSDEWERYLPGVPYRPTFPEWPAPAFYPKNPPANARNLSHKEWGRRFPGVAYRKVFPDLPVPTEP